MASDAVQRLKAWWPWALVAGALALVHGPSLAAHVSRALDPLVFNDDARQQIYPFFRYADPSLFPNDYVGDYYLDCLPLGYRALYTLSAPLIDPAVMSKIVMYFALLATVAGLGLTANRLAGKAAAWAAMALILGSSLYLHRMGGGLPRAFGFPILACALAALAYGRTRWLAVLVWLGACFYPVTGVIVGLATTLLLLFAPPSDRGDARDWELRRRLRFVAIVAGVSIALLLPTIVTSSKYGPVITPEGVTEYPEAGPGGRYDPGSRAPYTGFFRSAGEAAGWGVVGAAKAEDPEKLLSGSSLVVLILIAIVTAVGWLFFVVSSSAARRVVALGLAAFIGYWLARLAPPHLYLPTRYADYPMPLLVVLMVSTSFAGLFSMYDRLGNAGGRLGPKSMWRTTVPLVFSVLVVIALGGRGSSQAGLNIEIRNTALYDAVAELPPDAVVAGWPRMAVENVPYVGRRTAFLTYETHQAFHEQYADAMRIRMRALVDARFATSNEPLLQLRDEHQVTHLLVYLPDVRGERLGYFEPFDQWIDEARRASAGKRLVIETLVDQYAVFSDDTYVLIDLRGLSDPT